MKAEELMSLDKDAARALIRQHNVVYVYHNRVDAIGDKLVSEEQVFDAAEDAIEDIVKLVKKLTGANASNMIVTSDHGFIYQHRPIEESDFSSSPVVGDQILYRDRRFILGHGLKANRGLRRFTARKRPARNGGDADSQVDHPAAAAGLGKPVRTWRCEPAGGGPPGRQD